MLFAANFIGHPGMGEVRAQNLVAHVEWLEINREMVPNEITKA